MRFVTFEKNKKINVGIVINKETIIDLSFYSPHIPNDLNQIIESNSLEQIKKITNNPDRKSVV